MAGRSLTSLRRGIAAAIAALALVAVFAAPAGAGTPAAIDQYIENAPGHLGQPTHKHNHGGGGGAGGGGGGGVVLTPSGVPIPAGPAVADRVFHLAHADETSKAEQGGGPIPLTDYPATPLVVFILLIALIAALAGIARRVMADRAARAAGPEV